MIFLKRAAFRKIFALLVSRDVFKCIREDLRNTDIAEVLHLSQGRVSQLVNQVEIKIKQACQQLGLIE